MKIKVILTGGTIGSEKIDGIVQKGTQKDIVSFWEEKSNNNSIEFVRVNPYTVLSENISLDNWQSLIDELNKNNHDFDGIIITHGSDTLSYTSAMVSICCKNFNIPVVLTGANKVLSDQSSNGYSNFDKAVEIIKNKKIGVWTTFDKVYNASSIMEADYFSDKFTCGNIPQTEAELCTSENIIFKNRVKIIKEFPFADYSDLVLADNVKAVLIIGYHSGTANESTIKALYAKCREKGIDLYLQGLNSTSAVYSSTDEIRDEGVNIIYNDTPEYAFAKLMFKVNGFLK